MNENSIGKPTYGRENYPYYHAMWHLAAAGVIELSNPTGSRLGNLAQTPKFRPVIKPTVWSSLFTNEKPAHVALIDTGVAENHPNLYGKIPHRIDLTTSPFGVVEYEADVEPKSLFDGIDVTRVNELADPDQDKEVLLHIFDMLMHTKPIQKPDLRVYASDFAAHGTACAGIVVSKPRVMTESGFAYEAGLYPVWGVDPWSKVVPITTTFAPEPETLIAALIYAWFRGCHVILMPRGIEFPPETSEEPESSNEAKRRKHLDPTRPFGLSRNRAWALLKAMMRRLSQHVPIVTAAGNDGNDELSSPANLARNGNGIIAVGAVNALGRRASYSSYGENLTLVAPSNDAEVLTRHQVRLDNQATAYLDHPYADYLEALATPKPQPLEYAPEQIVTLDVPGPRGYAAGDQDGALSNSRSRPYDTQSLYSLFGGTSAAASIVAGVLALGARKVADPEKWFGNGGRIKEVLEAACTRSLRGRINPVATESEEVVRCPICLEPDGDTFNPKQDKKDNFEWTFGAGLVDAEEFLKKLPGVLK